MGGLTLKLRELLAPTAYYTAACFILFSPLLRSIKVGRSSLFQSWVMYSNLTPVCTLYFSLEDGSPVNLEDSLVSSPRVIRSENQAREFLRRACRTGGLPPLALVDLDCIKDRRWVNLEKRSLVKCP
jgi:hypothetical protein